MSIKTFNRISSRLSIGKTVFLIAVLQLVEPVGQQVFGACQILGGKLSFSLDFGGVPSDGTLIIPGVVNGVEVTSIADMAFQNNPSIINLIIPNSVTTLVTARSSTAQT